MAVKYVRSTTGSDANGGTNWGDAYATVAKALSVIAAGDTVYVSQAHAETQTTTITWTSPGTAGNLVRILCVNDANTPPTATATAASVTTTTTGAAITFGGGYAYVYGINFHASTGGTGAVIILGWTVNASYGWEYDSCLFDVPGSGASIAVGRGGFVSNEYVRWRNCNVSFAATASTIQVTGRWEWLGGALLAGSAIPTTLFTAGQSIPGLGIISGVDLSLAGSGKNLVAASGVNPVDIYLRNCKLGASVTVLTGTISGQGGVRVFLDNCDSANTNYRMERYMYQGSIVQETTKVRSGGASDGTTALSHKCVTLTTGPSLFSPLEGPWVTAWNDTSGSSKTATVEFLHDSLTNLQNSDIYLEVEYLGTSGFPESAYSNNRVADVFATPADCPAGVGTGSWNTTGLANPNSQKLQVTFTPQSKGVVRWRVCQIKTNYTVYVDPVASGLASVSRSYLLPPATYVNETASGSGGAILCRMRTGF